MNRRVLIVVSSAVLLHAVPGRADAQCDPVDFEGFAVGTVATNIIPGVTITAIPGSCGGAGSVLPIIVQPSGGTSSGIRAVGVETGCPDFSPDFLRLLFDEPQTSVEFTVGAQIGSSGLDFVVTWFNSSGVFIDDVPFESGGGVHRLVRIDGFDIRRVEIREVLGFFECIDDLVFDLDTTPPSVELDAPAFDTCVCGDEVISIVGTVADPDGVYGCDTFSYRPVNADEDEPWVESSTACGAFSGTLHDWNTTGVPAGRYYLRVTGNNACGLTETDITVVRIDRGFGSVGISGFDGGLDDGTLCGTVEVLGGISDGCGVASWTLEALPFGVIASGSGGRSCVITEWDTTTIPDGAYTLRVTATDNCGFTAFHEVGVVVDNSGTCECSADIDGDGIVDFSDLLLLLSNWG